MVQYVYEGVLGKDKPLESASIILGTFRTTQEFPTGLIPNPKIILTPPHIHTDTMCIEESAGGLLPV